MRKLTVVAVLLVSGVFLIGQVSGCGDDKARTTATICLKDTGQNKCYDLDAEIECGSAYVGQDAEYTTGCQPSYTDNGDWTVTDGCTGLMWQQEDDDITRDWVEALDYCEGLELAGQSDWRLPNIRELLSIVDYGRQGPSINRDFFPGTDSAQYGSSTTHADGNFLEGPWVANFTDGLARGLNLVPPDLYVRCVRSRMTSIICLKDTGQNKCYDLDVEIECGSAYVGQDAEYTTGYQPSYTDNGDWTVTDGCTGLMWQQEDDDVKRDWAEALGYCEGLELADQRDWRLPNVGELLSIVDYGRYDPAINADFFPGTDSALYWSSTTNIDELYLETPWVVFFNCGAVSAIFWTPPDLYVRCVR